MTNAAVVGIGIMGRGIVRHLAHCGIAVVAVDPDSDALAGAERYLEHDDRTRVTFASDVGEGLAHCDIAFECVPEDLGLKQSVIARIDARLPPSAIIATNTSTFDIDVLASSCASPSRLIGCHWFNPPDLMPGVEIVPGAQTAQHVEEWLTRFLASVGRQAVPVKNNPGFVANRLQEAMVAEALRLCAQGIAKPVEIDEIVKRTFGLRLAVCGVFELLDQIGLRTQVAGMRYLKDQPGGEVFGDVDCLEQHVRAGRLGLEVGEGFYQYSNPQGELAWRKEALADVITAVDRARLARPAGVRPLHARDEEDAA